MCRAFSPGKRFELQLESVNVKCRREGRKEVENAALRQRTPSAFQSTSVSAAVRLMDGEAGCSMWAGPLGRLFLCIFITVLGFQT